MLRNKNLIPLSHQHHQALALCVRLDRGIRVGEVELEAWQSEIQQLFENELGIHFTAEEAILFPAASQFAELQTLVQELLAEHAVLRDCFARAAAREFDAPSLVDFGVKLAQHIRKEERQLFEGMQRVMSSAELEALGAALDAVLKHVSHTCSLPNEVTRLRSRTIGDS
jgi:hemerythrin-like domain-containing protein